MHFISHAGCFFIFISVNKMFEQLTMTFGSTRDIKRKSWKQENSPSYSAAQTECFSSKAYTVLNPCAMHLSLSKLLVAGNTLIHYINEQDLTLLLLPIMYLLDLT